MAAVIDIDMTEKEWTQSIHYQENSFVRAVLQCAVSEEEEGNSESTDEEDSDPEEEESPGSEEGGIHQRADGEDGEV